MEKDMKPCPFCGEEDVLIWRPYGTAGTIGVRCEACMANTAARYTTEEAAIEAWNMRPFEEAQGKRIEELENIIAYYEYDASTIDGVLHIKDDTIAEIRDTLAELEQENRRLMSIIENSSDS